MIFFLKCQRTLKSNLKLIIRIVRGFREKMKQGIEDDYIRLRVIIFYLKKWWIILKEREDIC